MTLCKFTCSLAIFVLNFGVSLRVRIHLYISTIGRNSTNTMPTTHFILVEILADLKITDQCTTYGEICDKRWTDPYVGTRISLTFFKRTGSGPDPSFCMGCKGSPFKKRQRYRYTSTCTCMYHDMMMWSDCKLKSRCAALEQALCNCAHGDQTPGRYPVPWYFWAHLTHLTCKCICIYNFQFSTRFASIYSIL